SGPVVQLEQGLLADDDRRGQLNERRASRRRFLRSRLDPFLQAVVIEAECGGGATDAMMTHEADSQVPQWLRNASAPRPPLPPGLKPAPALGQILRQLAALTCTRGDCLARPGPVFQGKIGVHRFICPKSAPGGGRNR